MIEEIRWRDPSPIEALPRTGYESQAKKSAEALATDHESLRKFIARSRNLEGTREEYDRLERAAERARWVWSHPRAAAAAAAKAAKAKASAAAVAVREFSPLGALHAGFGALVSIWTAEPKTSIQDPFVAFFAGVVNAYRLTLVVAAFLFGALYLMGWNEFVIRAVFSFWWAPSVPPTKDGGQLGPQ